MSKAPPKLAAEGEAPVAKSKKKLIIIIAAVLVLAIGGGVAAMMMMKKGGDSAKSEKADEPAKIPVFMTLDQFVVNLQSDSGDKYLQIQMSLQAHDDAEIALIKANMPQVRNRLVMLLSSKKAEEILTPEGKNNLIKDIKKQINLPFVSKGSPQKVSDIFFVSFIVQ